MAPLLLKVYVDPRAGIVAGKTVLGNQTCAIREEELQALPELLRYEVALAYEGGATIGERADEPRITEPTLAAIVPVLEHRAKRRREVEEESRKQSAREAESAAVRSREVALKDNARSKALRAWVEKNGDDEQRARMAEGFLPEDEILEDVCDDLLALPGFRPYEFLHRGDACDCACAGRVVLTEDAPRYLDAFQFAKLQEAREAVPDSATVTVIEHRAACPACSCVPLARMEARVTMAWNGWLLVRQYALG